jgi:hypothetical protein
MAIGDDFGIDYTNKRIYHQANNNVYTVNQLYTWVQDTFDELAQMDNPVPMSAQTPNAYTMINSWFLDIGAGSEAHKYLNQGAIATIGYDCGTYTNGVRAIAYNATTAFGSSDIGETITSTGNGDTGTIVGYDERYTVGDAGIVWIRPDAAGDDFDAAEAYTVSNSSAAGSFTAVSTTGEELFANVYTLGTIADTPNAQVYIFQSGDAISEWSDKTNWDRGHIDVLIQVKEWGVEIDSGVITVFARQQGDLFDHFEIDLSGGGRNAVPLSTSTDLDNTTPDYYIFYDTGNGTDFTVGEVIADDVGDWSAEVVSEIEWAAGIGVLGIRGFKGTIADNDDFTGGTSGATGDVNGSATGVLGTAYIHYDNWGSQDMSTGDVLTGGTSTAKRRILGLYEDVGDTSGYLLLDTNTGITGDSRDVYYKDFTDDEALADESGATADVDGVTFNAVSGFDDITITFVNGTATYGSGSGTFTANERITFAGGEAIILLDSNPGGATGTVTLGNLTPGIDLSGKTFTGDISAASADFTSQLVGGAGGHLMNKAFEQQSSYPYDVIIECGTIYNTGRALSDVYEYLKFICEEDSTYQMITTTPTTPAHAVTPLDGEEYILAYAYSGYALKKSAPFGTFAGGVFFGAQSVWLEGMASSDNQNFSLIDSNGTTQDPPVSATMSVTSVEAGDRVGVFLTAASVINKSQYNSADSGNSAADTDFVIEESIAQDTPSAGKLRVVDDDGTDTFPEQRYRYSSWSGSTFTLLTTCGAGTVTTEDTDGDTLIDSAADFGGADTVEVGDVIYNSTTTDSATVLSIDSTTQLTTTVLEGGGDNQWGSGDGYSINVLDRTYDDGDTAYVPLIDAEASTTEVEQTVLFSANRAVLIRVRKKGIIPFETSGTFVSAGLTVAAIRTTDSIVS